MNKRLKVTLQVIAIILWANVAGIIWWRLWMYHGWIGTPRLIHTPMGVDGEASYNATQLEMSVICGLMAIALLVLYRLFKQYQRGSLSHISSASIPA